MTMREELRRARAAAHNAQKHTAGEALRDVFLCGAHPSPHTLFSFYYPFGDEIDTLPLAAALAARGHALCLPCLEEGHDNIVFRSYKLGDPLRAGPKFGILQPLDEAPIVHPHVLLMPLLGFDRHGNRMGLGGGYYDRTLAHYRATGQVRCGIGIAYAAQEVESIPVAPYDQKLDLIATEREVIDPSFSVEL